MSSEQPSPIRTKAALSTRWRSQLGNLLKIAISAGLLAYLCLLIDVRQTFTAILSAHPGWLAGAFAAFLCTFLLRAWRWRALIRDWGARVAVKELFIWYLVGSFFNSVLPTGFGGDLLRVYELSKRAGDPVMATNSVLVDRYLGIMVLLAMGLLAVPLGAGNIDLQVAVILGGLFMAGLLAGVLLLNQQWWQRAGQTLPILGRWLSGRLTPLEKTASYYSRRAILESTALSLLFNLDLILFNILLGQSLEIDIPAHYYFLYVPITSVALMLPSIGGLGVRELSYAALFPRAGVSEPLAVSLSLLVYLNTLAAGLIGGVIYLAGGAGDFLRDWRRGPR